MALNRIVRIIVGLALVGYGFYSQNPWFFLGLAPLITGLINWCPLESKMGTCDPASGCCSSAITEEDSACCAPTQPSAATTATPQTPPKTAMSWASPNATKIEILGTGCKKCKELEMMAQKAVSELEGDYQVVKVEDIQEIMNYGVTSTPALVIDGEIKSTGKVLSVDEIKELLS